MNSADVVQAVASVLAVVVAALGFYFVSRQLRKSAHSDIYGLSFAVKQVVFASPELRKYFYDGVAITSVDQAERDKVAVLAEMYCLYLEQIAIHARDLGIEKEAWLRYVKQMYDASPAIRQQMQIMPYSSDLYRVVGITPSWKNAVPKDESESESIEDIEDEADRNSRD